MERTASTAPQEQPDLAALPELMGQTASMVRTELLVRPAQPELPARLVPLRQLWMETWATATRPAAVVASLPTQLDNTIRPSVMPRSITTPPASRTRLSVQKRSMGGEERGPPQPATTTSPWALKPVPITPRAITISMSAT